MKNRCCKIAKEALIAFIQSDLPVSGLALTNIIDHFEGRVIKKNEFSLKEGNVSNDYFFWKRVVRGFSPMTESAMK